MTLNDRIFGKISITEPVLIELIKSKPLQRLKAIDQSGYYEPWFPGTKHSRFEHSVGVCWLLKKYGAPIEEQIAGLIHDVSHTAFSHTSDYIFDTGSEREHTHQDKMFEEMVKRSDIPKIIKKHGFNLNYILNDKNFPLKEKDLPDLCADRINYSLLTATVLGKSKSVQRIISNLSVHQNRWVFKDFVVAKEFAELFREINNKFYSGLPSATMFRTLADYLRYAITKKYISEKDMYETDSYVLAKIKPYLKSDSRLRLLFRRLSRKTTIKNNPDNYDVEVYCKSRIINPLCWHNKKIMKISEIDKDWGKVLKQESIPKHYYLKFVD